MWIRCNSCRADVCIDNIYDKHVIRFQTILDIYLIQLVGY